MIFEIDLYFLCRSGKCLITLNINENFVLVHGNAPRLNIQLTHRKYKNTKKKRLLIHETDSTRSFNRIKHNLQLNSILTTISCN